MISRWFSSSTQYYVFLACSVLIVAVGLYGAQLFYHDDALISLRYARNLINGDGLVWNTGERVEGYTNFLHVMLVAGLGWLGIDLRIASQIIGLLAYALILLLCLHAFDRFTPSRQRASATAFVLASLMLFANLDLVVWGFGGLEVVVVAAFILAAAFYFLRYLDEQTENHLVTAGFFLTLAGLTRIDTGLFYALSTLFLLPRCISQRRINPLLKLLLPALLFVPYFLWKYHYYGDLLPNTVYAKASHFNTLRARLGFIYLFAFLVAPPFLYIFIPLLSIRHRQLLDEKLIYLLFLLSSHAAYVFFVGGDHMRSHRFFVPVTPLAILALYLLLSKVCLNWRQRGKTIALSLCIAWIILQCIIFISHRAHEDDAAYVGHIVAEHIKQHWPGQSTIALSTAGSTPYYAADYRYIDMLGLNDAHIAHQPLTVVEDSPTQQWPGHNKGDGAYILQRAPDYIIIGPAQGVDVDEAWFLSGMQLAKIPAFKEQYEKHSISLDVTRYPFYEKHIATQSGQLQFVYYQKKSG